MAYSCYYHHTPILSLTAVALCAALGACIPFKGELGGSDGTDTLVTTEPPGVTESGATLQTGGGDTDTGDPACEVDDFFDFLFPDDYADINGALSGADCVLVDTVDNGLESVQLNLQCGDSLESITILSSGPMVNWPLYFGETFEVHSDTNFDDTYEPSRDWVALRSGGRLIYASARGDVLSPFEGNVYAPLILGAEFGACGFTVNEVITEDGGPHGFYCDELAPMHLSVVPEGPPAEPRSIASGQSDIIEVPGGQYTIDVRKMSRGRTCSPDYPSDMLMDVYAFAIVWQPE